MIFVFSIGSLCWSSSWWWQPHIRRETGYSNVLHVPCTYPQCTAGSIITAGWSLKQETYFAASLSLLPPLIITINRLSISGIIAMMMIFSLNLEGVQKVSETSGWYFEGVWRVSGRFLQGKSEQVKLGHIKAGQVRSGQVESGHVKSGQVESGQVESGQVKLGQVKLRQIKSEHVK